jgi:hypothetical protein
MKIKEVELTNYGPYKHEVFSFIDGLNTITASGDAGKSNLQHAMAFVFKNYQGNNYASHWIQDDKGKIKKGETCSVEIRTFEGDSIKRVRTRTENMYIINNNDPIQNFNQSVPEDVQRILNINEVNTQSQFETHFMLNDNSSTVAKTLNKMVNLEIIDESISNAGKIIRKIKKEKDASDINLKKYSEEIAKFDFIEAMGKDVNELLELEKELIENKEGHEHLVGIRENLENLSKELKSIEDITSNSTLVENVLKLHNALDEKIEQRTDLFDIKDSISTKERELKEIDRTVKNKDLVEKLLPLFDLKSKKVDEYNKRLDCIENIEAYEAELKTYTDVDKYKGNVAELLTLYDELDTLKKEYQTLEGISVSIEDWEDDLRDYDKSIEEDFEKIKDEACPVCGGEMKKEVC